MKRNLYYHNVFQRTNKIKVGILSFFLAIASWPRMLIEVFLRKNFGERYFSTATAVTLVVIVFWIPFMFNNLWFLGDYYSYERPSFFSVILKHITWYIYLAAFVYYAWQRKKEVDREPSVFDFARFSLSTGRLHPKLLDIKINGKYADHRLISTLIEPGIFFVAGVLLIMCKQMVGGLFIFVSISYSLSWYGAYYMGDQFIMDTIDEMICNEEMVDSFVDGKPASETRGFEMHCKQPNNASFRRQVVDHLMDDEEVSEAF